MTIELSQHAQYSRYSQLEQGQIRLLALHPGSNEDEPIECELFNCELESAPSYEALSYFWGVNRNTREISLHGSTFRVREALFNALSCLRQRRTNRLLWIDFICIDQRNQAEIYDQISGLGEIYTRAKSVPIYVGEATIATDKAMDYLMQLHEGGTLEFPPDRLDEIVIEGIQDMLSRPYFQRAWILQDAFHARAAILHCGFKAVPSKTMIRACELLPVKIDPLSAHILDLMPGSKSRREGEESSKIQLYDLLQRFQHTKTTDPRDKIYSVLEMVDFEHSKSVILPDYSLSQKELMRAVITNLCYCELDCVPELQYDTMDEFLADLAPIDNKILEMIFETSLEIDLAFLLRRGLRYIRLNSSLVEAAKRNKSKGNELAEILLEAIRKDRAAS